MSLIRKKKRVDHIVFELIRSSETARQPVVYRRRITMSAIESIVTNLLAEIDRIVDRKVEEKLPEMFRAVGFPKTNEVENLVGVLEVARLLGRNLSTPESVRSAKQFVYGLARRRLFPSVRISHRCLKFDLAKVREVIERGGNGNLIDQHEGSLVKREPKDDITRTS